MGASIIKFHVCSAKNPYIETESGNGYPDPDILNIEKVHSARKLKQSGLDPRDII